MHMRRLGLLAVLSWASVGAMPVVIDLEPAGGGNPRWRDIADHLYSPSYRASFSYASASVQLRYESVGTTFTGRLIGEGLKPFFAYQLKFTAAHGDPMMEPLGYMGRWSWAGGPLNVSDSLYEANKSNPAISSFMVFDYAVTNASGHIDEAISVDSTYHVLWRYGISGVPGVRPPGAHDGFSIETFVDPTQSPAGTYEGTPSPDTVKVYGECENTAGNVRPYPGDLFMPAGDYVLDFALTEESFHGSGTGDGWWMTALQSPASERVAFTVAATDIPEPCSAGLLSGAIAALLGWFRRGGRQKKA
jgi:hypothetical protein